MKHLTTGMLLLLCFAFAVETKAQNTDQQTTAIKKTKTSEYILEVPKMESLKLLPLFLDKIHQQANVQFKGFCQSRNLLFIESGRVELERVQQILDELGLIYFMKHGASIKSAISSCDSKMEIEESLKLDLNQSSGHE